MPVKLWDLSAWESVYGCWHITYANDRWPHWSAIELGATNNNNMVHIYSIVSAALCSVLWLGFMIPVLNDNPGNQGFFSKYPGIPGISSKTVQGPGMETLIVAYCRQLVLFNNIPDFGLLQATVSVQQYTKLWLIAGNCFCSTIYQT